MPLDMSTSVALVLCNFLFWGHWPICAKFAAAPSQPFGVLMVCTQTLCAWTACFMSPGFVATLVSNSQHPLAVLSVVLGGAALAIGDFAASAAIERLGVAVGGPVCFSCMLVCGAMGDFLLEGSARPLLLFAGVGGCMLAVVADSQSHPAPTRSSLASSDSATVVANESLPAVELPAVTPTPSSDAAAEKGPPPPAAAASVIDIPLEEDQAAAQLDARKSQSTPQPDERAGAAALAPASEFQRGMVVAVAGGCIGGMWTVLSTLASHAFELDPLVLLFYFHLGEVLFIVPVVLGFGHLFGGTTTLTGLGRMLRALTRRQAAWTCGAGFCIAVGYLCYFATRGSVPRPAAYGFGCAAGSTGMVWGIAFFGEYEGAGAHKKALLLLAFALYPSSIALIALSMVGQ